jgi:hypothetical protein
MKSNALGTFFCPSSDLRRSSKLKTKAKPTGKKANVSSGNTENTIANTVKTHAKIKNSFLISWSN